MAARLSDTALDQLFREARTHNAWQDKAVPDSLLHELIDLMKMGPTSANCLPARVVFVRSPEAKERLKPFLSSGNRDKTMAAPVCCIVGFDLEFYEKLPKFFPHNKDAKNWFTSSKEFAASTAFRNGSLQGAYLILAARSLGLDAGPMSGYDQAGVDRTFFPDGKVKSNFLCNLGCGDPKGLFARSPRPDFDEIARIE